MQDSSDLHLRGDGHISAGFWGQHGAFVTVGLRQMRTRHRLQLCSGILCRSSRLGRGWWLWKKAAEVLPTAPVWF